MVKKRIIIFGFSGSGKSTLADRLGKELEMSVVHPSGMLRALMTGKKFDIKNSKAQKGFWESREGLMLLTTRIKDSVPPDMEIDKILLRSLDRGHVIMESWNMAWLWKGKALRIYLKCARKERALRAAKRACITPKQALKAIEIKDRTTRTLFKRIYGIDIQKDLDVFDVVIDTKGKSLKEVEKMVLVLI